VAKSMKKVVLFGGQFAPYSGGEFERFLHIIKFF
jgi:hypothetical protein